MTQSSFRVDDARGLDSMSTDRRMQLSCGLREAREDGVRKRGGAGDGREGEEEEVGEAQRGGGEMARGEWAWHWSRGARGRQETSVSTPQGDIC